MPWRMNSLADGDQLQKLHKRKKLSHFDLKSFWPEKSLTELSFPLGFWVIGGYLSQIDLILRVKWTNWQFDSQYRVNLTLNIEPIWLSISSQFDSNILQLLGILSRISVPSVTQFFKSKRLNFFSVRRLTRQVRGMNLPDPFSRQSKLILFWEEDKLETDLFSLPKSSIILLEGRPMLN